MSATREADPGLVERTLDADGRRTREALLDYLPAGGFYDIVAEYPSRPGKGIRPALCLASCRAYGGHTEHALGAAVAIELLHNAFLVHDDICDGATVRRGSAALHVEHGIPMALSAGDALAWLALRPLLDDVSALGERLALEVLVELQHMTRRTIEGQAAELAWRERGVGGLDAGGYLDVVLDKTCWYSAIHPCRIGALIGSRGHADLDQIARFGFFVGAVLQIRDDVESVTDRSQAPGKEFGADIVEGKPTLILIHLLRAASPAVRDEVLRLVGDAGEASGLTRDERVERVAGLMEEHGSIDYCCAFADGLAGAALAECEMAMSGLPHSADRDFVRSLVLHLRDPLVRGR